MSRAKFLRQTLLDVGRSVGSPAGRPEPFEWDSQGVTGSCLGHSTVLIKTSGLWVLTDPVFSTRVGIGWGPFILGPKRYTGPALMPKAFPAPDLLLLSHAHFDHFDTPSLRRFSRDTPVVVPTGVADLARRLRFRHVHELAWDRSCTLETRGGRVRITAFRVAHWGARMLRDHHRSYCGYVLERDGRRVCFAGDTAYTTAFSQLPRSVGEIDLMLMPIGAYNPWIRAHCDPEQAKQMADDAGARYFVPIHHQTFKLSSEPMMEPSQRIRAAFAQEPQRLLAAHVGETFHLPEPARQLPHATADLNRA